jgi:hypothetical protein
VAGARCRASKAGIACAVAVALALLGAGCGSSAKQSSGPQVISAGQIDIQLPDGWKVTSDGKGAIRPVSDTATAGSASDGATGASGASGASGATGDTTSDTIPLATEDPTTTLFKAFRTFQSCLSGLGVKFIGAPNQSDPNSPTNDPTYIKNLSTCAAKSNILAALKNQQSYSDNLTPDQIEQQNKGYLVWRDCMIGRGWGIPEPKPDEKGRLFSFSGAQNGQGPNFKPPPGEDILSSSDVSECASEAQQKVPQNSGG